VSRAAPLYHNARGGSAGRQAVLRLVMHWLATHYTERRCLVAHDERAHVLHVQFGAHELDPPFALRVELTQRGLLRLKTQVERARVAACQEQQNAILPTARDT
jgi:hypothetical protein